MSDLTEPVRGLTASWGTVLRDVRTLAADLTNASVELARQVPVVPVEQLLAGWSRAEDTMLRELKTRLDQLDEPRVRRGAPLGQPGAPRSAARMLEDLLTASIEADSTTSVEELYRALLLHLVPDEARILAALADGTSYPLIHVQSRSNGWRTVLANASTVGRAAGVQVPDAVPLYVGRLRALGLAEEGPADDSLAVHYDILLGEPSVRRAEEDAKEAGRLNSRMIRRTLRISPLGRRLWQACRPEDDLEPSPLSDAELLDADAMAPALRRPEPGPGFQPDTAFRPVSTANGTNGTGPALS